MNSTSEELLLQNKYNVKVSGNGPTSIVFAHGYGCDQNMWRFIAPHFEREYKVVLFDYVGHGGAITAPFDKAKYSSLDGFADDLIEIARSLGLRDAIFVGHSVSATIGILASIREPTFFKRLILVCPSPRYIRDGDYDGGFSQKDVEELIDFLDSNHLGWSNTMAPTIMGNPDRPELSEELSNSFCRTDPEVAKVFAQVTFFSDNREDLSKVTVPSLILQCSKDSIAPLGVGEFVKSQIPRSTLVLLNATGHCPHLSAPAETTKAIEDFLAAD